MAKWRWASAKGMREGGSSLVLCMVVQALGVDVVLVVVMVWVVLVLGMVFVVVVVLVLVVGNVGVVGLDLLAVVVVVLLVAVTGRRVVVARWWVEGVADVMGESQLNVGPVFATVLCAPPAPVMSPFSANAVLHCHQRSSPPGPGTRLPAPRLSVLQRPAPRLSVLQLQRPAPQLLVLQRPAPRLSALQPPAPGLSAPLSLDPNWAKQAGHGSTSPSCGRGRFAKTSQQQ